MSSTGESIYSLESDAPNRIAFDLERIMRTRYRIDTYQKTYFVIDSFEQLMDATAVDFTPIYARLAELQFAPDGTALLVPDKLDPNKSLDEQVSIVINAQASPFAAGTIR